MTARRSILLAVLACAAALLSVAPAAPASSGPDPSTSVTRGATGSPAAGTRVTWWLPDRPDGRPAPVVVVLHGFAALDPVLYGATIQHLWRRGYAVVYPQFQRADAGFLTDTDQNRFLARAIDATDVALDRLGSAVDREDLVVYGHSLGGLLAAAWNPSGGARARAAVLANPSTATEIPADVPVSITPIDIAVLAPHVDVPVFLLTGDRDTIAPPAQATTLSDQLTAAPSREVWLARTDLRGWPLVFADHAAPLNGARGLGVGLLDQRFYHAALDQALGGATTLTFAFGRRPFTGAIRPPLRLR
ncbi:MAG: dienelactone hydrolase family protein [Solirubrobacteraceae bacterium]|nr:dienelactone hydrolase family protein [Solirubrobacteraceae bacterium]